MYLKGLDVNGFKSFADKISLEFDNGITAIVGPNGSGKSNVSDAIRWVLGEQSVKSLRGSKMEDVIFAGTQKRSPMGFASVSITFDNKDRIFSADCDEVKVTRKLHRSGESEYKINNAPCRLKDIHELFMDTGLGREGYSVIGQGKIEQILSSKAEERRHIFEEAAGITKYKYRKAEAEKKLLAADDNLLRIKDLITALSDQVGPLENQSRKAREYLNLKEALKGLEINIFIRNIDKMRQSLKEGSDKFSIAFNQLNDEKDKLHGIENEIESKTQALEELNNYIKQVREQLFDVEKGSGDLKNKIALLENNCKNNSENIDRWQEEIKLLKERADETNKARDEFLNETEILNKEKEALKSDICEMTKKLESFDKSIQEFNESTEDLKSQILDCLSEISSIKARDESMDVLLKNFDERKATLKEDMENKAQIKLDLEKRIALSRDGLNKANEKKENALSEMEKLKDEYFKVVKKLDEAKTNQNSHVNKLNEKTSKKNILEDLEKGYEGYAKSVKAILSEKIDGVRGVVSKLLTVEDKYITAIEVALSNMLQNIVTDNEETAKKCISYLKDNKAGRATFLPLTSVKGEVMKNPPKDAKGYIGVACELISCEKVYEDIFKSLLGRTIICDNIDNATKMAKDMGYKVKIVTLDGQQINPGGSFTGGSISPNHGLLNRAREIEILKEEISAMEKQADKNDDQIASYKEKINKIASIKEGLEGDINGAEHEIIKLNSQENADTRSLDELLKSIEMLTNENGDIINEIADIDKQKKEFREKIEQTEENIRLLRKKLNELEISGAYTAEQREKLHQGIVDMRMKESELLKDIELLDEKMRLCTEDIASYEKDAELKNADIRNNTDINSEILKEIEMINQRILEAKEGSKDLYDEIEGKQKDYSQGHEHLKKLQQSLKSQNEIIYDLQQEVVRLEAKNNKYESDIEAVINRLWDEYELTYNTALEHKKSDFNMSEAQREASSVRGKIKALGHINIDAIEQYKEVKEKFDHLTEQKKDLDETKVKLEGIINEMQDVMVKKFSHAFSLIKDKFNETFSALFGGGVGRLSLSDPSNILESGIDIEVQPPGKKLQNMMVLSGGEKALSAIALLFSVLEVRPTPFCILDEVEAALDETNVYRFADYIKKYSKKTQFIVVTHRRGTMEAADIMYGVTMQEKGISKLLKLKFDDLEDYSSDGA